MSDGKNKGGRPPFRPTAKQRADVSLFAAAGMSEEGIAAAIGICRLTLRQKFADELRAAHETELARNLRRLRKAADAGNVAAMKHLDARFVRISAEKSFVEQRAAEPEGKKEAARRAAETAGAGTDWGDDLRLPDRLPDAIN